MNKEKKLMKVRTTLDCPINCPYLFSLDKNYCGCQLGKAVQGVLTKEYGGPVEIIKKEL
ncbi:hypothetical protein LCGC14_1048100 [marine sediment metagenome]|uniref:Uncharacterized protein n=1 Tax=marine sediment metagenome TaxID=412755 RepID=A0A0F9MU56_9ZZZZ